MRSLTSEWECDNGRKALFNAHPHRPSQEAWLTYAGNRMAVKVARSQPGAGARFVTRDGKFSWTMQKDNASLEIDGQTTEPIKCKLIPKKK